MSDYTPVSTEYTLGSGLDLSDIMNLLALQCKETDQYGPDWVYENHITAMPRELLEHLVMVSAIKRSYELKSQS